MNTLELLAELQRYYDQKTALYNKKNTPEYNEKQYNRLMNFYNGKIKEFRSRIEKHDNETLIRFDTDRALKITVTEGVEFIK